MTLSVRKCRCVFKTFRISSTWIGRNVRPRMPVIRFALWVKYEKKARCKNKHYWLTLVPFRFSEALGLMHFLRVQKDLSYPILRVGNFFCPITHLRNAVFYFFLLEVRFRFEQALQFTILLGLFHLSHFLQLFHSKTFWGRICQYMTRRSAWRTTCLLSSFYDIYQW